MQNDLKELLTACKPIVRSLSSGIISDADTHITEEEGSNFIQTYRKIAKNNHKLELQEAALIHNLAACLMVCMPLVDYVSQKEKTLNTKNNNLIKPVSWQIRQKEFLQIIEQARKVLIADNRKIYFDE